jgi:hypothetical protein
MHYQVCFPPSVECFDTHIINCITSSVEGLTPDNERTINIYPVPAKDFVTVDLKISGTVRIEILNMFGAEVYNKAFYSAGNFSGTIFVGDLHEGMYLVNITTNQKNFTRKLSIER